jgi:hypothetical protein
MSISAPLAREEITGAFDMYESVNVKIFIGASHLRRTVFRQIELSFGE